MKKNIIISLTALLVASACGPDRPSSDLTGAENEVTIMNMNPGHFHAGLIHLHDYPQIDPKVYVYAPEGDELNSYLDMVNRFNTRDDNPTQWEPEVYTGETLIRPHWFFDTTQQGETIVDVSTHLVDKIFWQTFPEQPVDYRNPDHNVDVIEARAWSTDLTGEQFELITGVTAFPDYLLDNVESNVLKVNANGEFLFRANGVYAKVGALWGFTNPDGGDTHYSIIQGTKANLVVRQDLEQDFKATLYVEPHGHSGDETFETILQDALETLSVRYDGLTTHQTEFGWGIAVPDEYVETHEEHFTRVTQPFLDALLEGGIPEWERRNLETKYYLTTQAYEMSI